MTHQTHFGIRNEGWKNGMVDDGHDGVVGAALTSIHRCSNLYNRERPSCNNRRWRYQFHLDRGRNQPNQFPLPHLRGVLDHQDVRLRHRQQSGPSLPRSSRFLRTSRRGGVRPIHLHFERIRNLRPTIRLSDWGLRGQF